MDKIKLTNQQKTILRLLQKHNMPNLVPKEYLTDFAKLKSLGLVNNLEIDQNSVNDIYGPELSSIGKDYILNNPKLKDPPFAIEWNKIGVIFAIISALATILGVIIAYLQLKQ